MRRAVGGGCGIGVGEGVGGRVVVGVADGGDDADRGVVRVVVVARDSCHMGVVHPAHARPVSAELAEGLVVFIVAALRAIGRVVVGAASEFWGGHWAWG